MIKLSLCQGGCCPTVEINKDTVVIRDDRGGQVFLTKEQMDILLNKYTEIEGKE